MNFSDIIYNTVSDKEVYSRFHQRRIKFLKNFYITVIFLLSALLVVDYIEHTSFILAIHMIRIAGILLAMVLLWQGLYLPSIYIAFSIIFFTTMIGAIIMETQNTFVLLFFPLCAILYYLTQKIIVNILFFIITTLSVIYIFYYQSNFQLPVFNTGIIISIVAIMFVFFVSLSFFVFEFKLMSTELAAKNQILENQNKELSKKNNDLTKSNEVITKMLSVIAHDLRNPFNNIIGFSNLLYKNRDRYDKQKQIDFLSMIVSSSETGYGILESLLVWTQNKTNSYELKVKVINIYSFLRKLVSEFQIQMEKKQLRFSINCDSNLDFSTDEVLLSVILRNLIANAVKFSPRNSEISLNIEFIDENICFSVINQGEMVTEEIKEKILDKNCNFSMTGTDGERGSGIGLAICVDFVERLNGDIDIKRIDGKNCFIVTIPNLI